MNLSYFTFNLFNQFILLIIFIIIVSIIVYFNYEKEITYFVEPSNLDSNFKHQVRNIIQETNFYNKYNNIKEINESNADIIIKLSDRKSLDKWHDEKEYYPNTNKEIRFSLTVQNYNKKPIIYIDANNWLYGVPESGLSLDEYRQYVIRHEFLHALGYDHQPCNEFTAKNKTCSVLYQSTRGCPKGFKCGFKTLPVDFTKKIENSYF